MRKEITDGVCENLTIMVTGYLSIIVYCSRSQVVECDVGYGVASV